MENGEDRVQASVGPLRAALNSWGGGEARGQPTVFGTAFVIHTHPASLSGHYFKKYFNPHLTVSFTFFGENDNVGREF